MKRALHPLLALVVAVSSQVLLLSDISLGQTTNDCGNPGGSVFFNSTGGNVNDNLICGSQNSLAGLSQAIAVGIQNTIQNANSQKSAVGIGNTIQNANSQNSAV
ncbi:MAG TPA: hypothetical protein IGP91_07920, partial [Thermosynechococcus sp. M46_R2017_013]|nr:hypothetical protein [Thermosynechococcus sp. M46_R2017_013]